ncbi:hypothetical protein [Corynebacterium sp.]|uniref:hypothetical protein n=1 Tax=Corynebacterium sp. TaxID=1720 RepID=UPI0025BE3BD1|nr:hypothetical protein [Corynebacterium sp.]
MTIHHHLRLTPEGAAASPRLTHKALMRSLAHVRLNPDAPRADAALTFVRDGNLLDIYTRDGLSLAAPWQFGTVESAEPLTVPTYSVRFTVDVACQYRPAPPSDVDGYVTRPNGVRPVGKLMPVPDERLDTWAAELLGRKGVTGTDIQVRKVANLQLDGNNRNRRESIPVARITGTALGAQLAAVIADGGIGRGRNFGLGHIILTPGK